MHTLPALPVSSRLSALRFALALTSALLLGVSVAQAAATGLLNDTGQTQCDNGSNLLGTCTLGNTGDSAAMPRQDGRFGRDVASPSKLGGGVAGFDFTPLDASGIAIALTGSPAVPAATPRCVKDNLTNLIWEVKTGSGLQDNSYTYAWRSAGDASCGGSVSPCNTDAYIASMNAADLCGETANDWRLPTRRELLGIVHFGAQNPAIDSNYFPATQSDWYWASEADASDADYAWIVNFSNGSTYTDIKYFPFYVRLVRSAQ